MRILLAMIFAAFAALPGSGNAATQEIYKSWAPDGSVTYAAKPEPGATKVERIDVRTLSSEQRRAAQLTLLHDRASITQGYARIEGAWKAVDDEINRAQKALAHAEKALRMGRTPLPGERRGLAGGGSRLDASYFARLHFLEDAIQAARKRLDKAYDARNNLRS